MIINASLDHDAVLVLSWNLPGAKERDVPVTFKDIGAALSAVGFTVYELIEPGTDRDSVMIAVPLPSIDSKVLSDYVHHILESRLGVFGSSTTWTPNGWAKVINDVKLEKYDA